MARSRRLLVEGGWYHVTARGNRRNAIFLDDTDRRRFLGLVEALPDRFHTETHSFMLMSNHYHLLLRTLHANLSQVVHWLNVSYSTRFNWAHSTCGHVFQGRFNAALIEDTRGVIEVARYMHLNPVRLEGLGLDKTAQRRAKVLGCPDPGAELVRRRLEQLRTYPWSSWRVYSGAESAPAWLETATIAEGCGGKTRQEQRRALREFTEAPIRQGRLDSPWDGLIGGLVIGSQEFAQRVLKPSKNARPIDVRQFTRAHRMSWPQIVELAETALGRHWNELLTLHGNWGRDGTIYVAVHHGAHRLSELVPQIEGLEYAAAGKAIERFGHQLKNDPERQKFVETMKRRLAI